MTGKVGGVQRAVPSLWASWRPGSQSPTSQTPLEITDLRTKCPPQPPSAWTALGQKGEEGRGRGSLDGSHAGKRLWSGPWLEHRKAFQLEVKQGYLEESLSYFLSMEGLDEQRQSIVLELYCRKAEREKVERERERLAMVMWRGGHRKRVVQLEMRVRKVRA